MGKQRFYDICNKGTLEEVRKALANGADVNERDGTDRGFNRTGLMYAVGADHELLVSLLLQQPGVLVNVQDDDGYCPLLCNSLCNKKGGTNVVELLPRH